ncbi:MAG: hypothetical protein ACYC96_01150 [Fimbriimonadaceae bacterium]
MNMQLRVGLLSILCTPVVCHGQSILGIGVRAGYSVSGSFAGKTGNSGSLVGPELGLDIPFGLPLPISGLGGLQFNLSPSLFVANGGWSGAAFQGDVYRVLATARLDIPASPVYLRIGAGLAYASGSHGDFTSQGAYETQLGVGVSIFNKLPALKISADLSYHQSSLAQVRGWTIGLSAKF